MMPRRREKSGSWDSELEDLKYKYYKDFRDGQLKVTGSGKYLRCPFCYKYSRSEYNLSELEQHASRISKESKSATLSEKARHLGMLKYLDRYGHEVGKQSRSTKESPHNSKSRNDDKGRYAKVTGERSCSVERIMQNVDNSSTQTDTGDTEHEEMLSKPGQIAAVRGDIVAAKDDSVIEPGEIKTEPADLGMIAKDRSLKTRVRISEEDLLFRSHAAVRQCAHRGDDEPIVWPWMAVIANLPVEKKGGRYVGDSGRKLKDEWTSKGYNPVKIQPLWDFQGHSGFAIVHFTKNWEGFKNALAFEKAFEADNHGKRDWYARRNRGDKLYGWLAREEEYYGLGLIGKHLQKNADLKTVSGIQKEDLRKDTSLMCNLSNQLESMSKKCERIEKKISKTDLLMNNIMVQKENMVQSYNEGTVCG